MKMKNITSQAKSGKFWKGAGMTALGMLGGEVSSTLLKKAGLSNTLSEVIGGVGIAATGFMLNKPEIAVGTTAIKGFKVIGGATNGL